jgi:hypothetical protein
VNSNVPNLMVVPGILMKPGKIHNADMRPAELKE